MATSTIQKTFTRNILIGAALDVVPMLAFYYVLQQGIVSEGYTTYAILAIIVVGILLLMPSFIIKKRMQDDLISRGQYFEAAISSIKTIPGKQTRYQIIIEHTHPLTGEPYTYESEGMNKKPALASGDMVKIYWSSSDKNNYIVDLRDVTFEIGIFNALKK